ncbi:hypothetical protein J6590_053184 [Homalodisca vitripennis]|nr:hypothetical protein J6590_053184 [Homalodisca vitripennis]
MAENREGKRYNQFVKGFDSKFEVHGSIQRIRKFLIVHRARITGEQPTLINIHTKFLCSQVNEAGNISSNLSTRAGSQEDYLNYYIVV